MAKIKSTGNRSLTWAKAATVGILIGGAVGTGAYFIYTSLANQETPIKYGTPITETIFNEVPVIIHETNPGAKDEEKQYFLSSQGMKDFKKKVETKLNFGPELFDLVSITIDDDNEIGSEANGNYYPGKDTINLSTKQFRKEGLPSLSANDTESPSLEKVKVDLLFQVFFHEYGHFIANKYLNGYSKGAKVGSWNPDFEANFEKDLQYDLKNSKPMLNIVKGREWQSMGAIYSAADIYQRVNFKKDYSFSELKNKPWKAIWAGKDPFFDTTKTKGYDMSNAKYLWSLDELYTRKYQQILFPQDDFGVGIYNENFISKTGFHYFRGEDGKLTNNITPYTYDESMYKDLSGGQSLYMADNPNLHKDTLIPLMNRHEGRDDEISVLFYDKDNNLRLGGYTDQKSYNLKIGGKPYTSTVINIPYFTSTKNKVTTTKNMWVSEALKISDVLHKTISSVKINAKSVSKTELVTSIRRDLDGMITTHRDYIHHPDYHLSYNVDTKGNFTGATIEPGDGGI